MSVSGEARPAVEPPLDAQSPWVQVRSPIDHPFVYRKMVRQTDLDAHPGDVVNLYDKAGKFVGRGLYNPRSQIAVRVLTHDDTPIDGAFWRGRLEQAVALRRRMNLDQVTDAYRLVHAEGDGLSGLVVERYADCLVFEMFSLGMYQRYKELAEILSAILGPPGCLDRPNQASPTWRTVLRARTRVERLEGFHLPGTSGTEPGRYVHRPGTSGTEPGRYVTVHEHGIRYRVDVEQGHRTGFFCDQRDNRLRLAQLCRDAAVLDLCCDTGGFSLCAQKLGGAREVTGVDLDEAAVATARENAGLNQIRVDFVYADASTYVRQMLARRRQFDVVVLDPPKLATYRAEIDDALRKYHDLNTLAVQVVRPDGVLLTCSCSGLVSPTAFTETVHRAAQHAGRVLQLFDRTGAAPDHPVMLNCPESAYLQALWFRVLG